MKTKDFSPPFWALALMLCNIAQLQISKFAEVVQPKWGTFLLHLLQSAVVISTDSNILTAESQTSANHLPTIKAGGKKIIWFHHCITHALPELLPASGIAQVQLIISQESYGEEYPCDEKRGGGEKQPASVANLALSICRVTQLPAMNCVLTSNLQYRW